MDITNRDRRDALTGLVAFYDIERDIAGQPPSAPCRRQELSTKVEALSSHGQSNTPAHLAKGILAKAVRYGLSRRRPSVCLLEDGRVANDNNSGERALRPLGIGRKNCPRLVQHRAELLPVAMTVR